MKTGRGKNHSLEAITRLLVLGVANNSPTTNLTEVTPVTFMSYNFYWDSLSKVQMDL